LPKVPQSSEHSSTKEYGAKQNRSLSRLQPPIKLILTGANLSTRGPRPKRLSSWSGSHRRQIKQPRPHNDDVAVKSATREISARPSAKYQNKPTLHTLPQNLQQLSNIHRAHPLGNNAQRYVHDTLSLAPSLHKTMMKIHVSSLDGITTPIHHPRRF